MQTAWSHTMIMPDGQESQHARRERAVHGQMRPHDAVPILHSAAGTYSALPSVQQGLSCFLPGRIKAIQQVLGGWTQQGATLPCPGNQLHGAWSQALTRLLLGLIEVGGKEQQMRKRQTQLLCQGLDLLLHRGHSLLWQFLQQGQQRFQFLLTSCAAQHPCLPSRTQHHDVEQGLQFLPEIAQRLGDILRSCDAVFVFSYVGRRRPSTSFLYLGHPLSLSLDDRQAILQLVQSTITAPLDLRSGMQHMPDIALLAGQSVHLAQGVLNGSSSITDTALADESLLVQIPPHQRPAFPIHRHRWQGGPHLSAVHIHHIERGFSSLTAVLFIQGPCTRRVRLLLAQPVLGTSPRFLHDSGNASQAEAHATQLQQTRLDIAITGMRFNQQGQHLFLHLYRAFDWTVAGFQGRLQGLCSFHFPSIQGLTRNLMGPTQLAQQPMCWLGYQQLTDPLASLLCCATMVHVSSLRTVFVLFCSPYLSGTLLATFPSTVTVVHALFEPCLSTELLGHSSQYLCAAFNMLKVGPLDYSMRALPAWAKNDCRDAGSGQQRRIHPPGLADFPRLVSQYDSCFAQHSPHDRFIQ